MYKISLNELIEFYDRVTPDNRYHATAINALMGEEFALALTMEYLKLSKRPAELVSNKCVTGGRKGPRLDAWIKVTEPDDGAVLYQTEIKNWSAHAVGGRAVPTNATTDELNNHRKGRWRNQFDNERQTLRDSTAMKVLVEMKYPENTSQRLPVRPLIVFWDPMSDDGSAKEWFDVEVQAKEVKNKFNLKSSFTRLHVFSMSNFVRNLRDKGETHITVDLPQTEKRIRWLDRLLTRN